jgi:hypothetical protein
MALRNQGNPSNFVILSLKTPQFSTDLSESI